ncbi:MAG: hypothetical protein WBG92_14120 [Thiohalocapsa sp.]
MVLSTPAWVGVHYRMLAALAVPIILVVLLLRRFDIGRSKRGSAAHCDVREILDSCCTRGEIDEDEYLQQKRADWRSPTVIKSY